MIQDLLARKGEFSDFARRLKRERIPDIVDLFNTKTVEETAKILANLPDEQAVGVFDEAGLDYPGELIAAIPRPKAARILTGMSSDRAAEVFRQLEEPGRTALFKLLDAETKSSLNRVLRYPMHSAGSIMTTEFVSVPADWTVAQTLDHIRHVERTPRDGLRDLCPRSCARARLRQVGDAAPADRRRSRRPACFRPRPTRPLTVSPLTDREEAARLISKYDLLAVPVVDDAAKCIGIVTVDDMIDAIVAGEHRGRAELRRHGGARRALHADRLRPMIRKRAGWLCALFLGEMLTASAMQHF